MSVIDSLKSKRVSIRQYVNPEIPNMGLEKEGMSVFFGENGSGGLKEWLGYRQVGNQRIYLTGLDSTSNNITSIADPELRDATLKQVTEVKDFLEKDANYGVNQLNPNNGDFWKEIALEIRTPILELDLSDPKYLLLYFGIKGGGFGEVAPSYDYARTAVKVYKFYLHEDAEVMSIKTEITKLRNRAKGKLQMLLDEDPNKMFYIAKCVLPITKGYRASTVNDIIYEDLNDYIEGTTVKTNLKQTPSKFLAYVEKDKADVLHEAIVKEALHQHFISKTSENVYINNYTTEEYGKNEEDIIAYLKNPLHSDELIQLTERVNKAWGK